MQAREDTSILTKEVDDAANNSESRSASEAPKPSTSSLLATIKGRVVLPQSSDVATVLKLSDAQDSEVLQQWFQINPDRATIDLSVEQAQKRTRLEEAVDSPEEGSDVPVKTLLPFDILSTYLLKNLFFNCIKENAKNATANIVTTGQIFGKLFESLIKSRPVPYYFIPNQNFVGLDTSSFDDDRNELLLVTMVINNLLNDAISGVSKTDQICEPTDDDRYYPNGEIWSWDPKTKTLANGLHHTMKNFGHIFNFVCAKEILEPMRPHPY
ncbi:hypothetical protein ACROYT_G034788 [Oculina patagonica]